MSVVVALTMAATAARKITSHSSCLDNAQTTADLALAARAAPLATSYIAAAVAAAVSATAVGSSCLDHGCHSCS